MNIGWYFRMMDVREREFVVEQLAASEARLLGLVEGLTAAQWGFREEVDRWSIAEIVEHLVVFEGFITTAVTNALQEPADPEKMALAAAKEPLVLGLAQSRGMKLKAREATRPVGRWVDGAALVAEFRAARARTIVFAVEAECDLRAHLFPHIAFGDLDCCQWLVVLGQHTLRHCLQIGEILRDVRFPAG
jgi:DinB superfamily